MNGERIEREDKQIEREDKLSKHVPGDFGTWNWEPEDDIPDWDDEVPEWGDE